MAGRKQNVEMFSMYVLLMKVWKCRCLSQTKGLASSINSHPSEALSFLLKVVVNETGGVGAGGACQSCPIPLSISIKISTCFFSTGDWPCALPASASTEWVSSAASSPWSLGVGPEDAENRRYILNFPTWKSPEASNLKGPNPLSSES